MNMSNEAKTAELARLRKIALDAMNALGPVKGRKYLDQTTEWVKAVCEDSDDCGWMRLDKAVRDSLNKEVIGLPSRNDEVLKAQVIADSLLSNSKAAALLAEFKKNQA